MKTKILCRFLIAASVFACAAFLPFRADAFPGAGSKNRSPRYIAITFDDGPHEKMTPMLLEKLEELQVRASFFLVGTMAEKNPSLVRSIFEQGHTVANHSYFHRNCKVMDQDELSEDLARCSSVIENIINQPVRFFRPPGGNYTSETLRTVRKSGLKTVLWDINSREYTGVSVDFMTRRVMRYASSGSIILFHSGVKRTVDVLPVLVAKLRKNGFVFVTLDEMFPRASLSNSQISSGRPVAQKGR